MKKVHLELGGKSAAIYLPDAAENAWHMCLGVFMAHQGQGCAAHDAHPRAARPQGRDHGTRRGVPVSSRSVTRAITASSWAR